MKASTELFDFEGRDNVKATIANVVKGAKAFDVTSVVIFATTVDSVLKLRAGLDESRRVIAVTFPSGYTAFVGGVAAPVGIIGDADRRQLHDAGVIVVQGIMPFQAFGSEGDVFKTVRAALDLFGGGLQLCIQAILMACDGGAVEAGQRCIAMSADTAIVIQSENAFNAFGERSRLAVEHILCKPITYTVIRPFAVKAAEVKKATSSSKALRSPDADVVG